MGYIAAYFDDNDGLNRAYAVTGARTEAYGLPPQFAPTGPTGPTVDITSLSVAVSTPGAPIPSETTLIAVMTGVTDVSQVVVTRNGTVLNASNTIDYYVNPATGEIIVTTNFVTGDNDFIVTVTTPEGTDSDTASHYHSAPTVYINISIPVTYPGAPPDTGERTINVSFTGITNASELVVTHNGTLLNAVNTTNWVLDIPNGTLSFKTTLAVGANNFVATATTTGGLAQDTASQTFATA